MLAIVVATVAIAVCYTLWTYNQFGRITISGLFVVLNTLSAVSAFTLLDLDRQADKVHFIIIFYTVFAFISSAWVLTFYVKRSARALHPLVTSIRPGKFFWSVFALSILITVLYYVAVGQSALIVGLRDSQGGGTDVTQVRLDAYAGNRYLFPGYVNQFKNVFLPSLAVLLVHWWRANSRHWVIPSIVVLSVSLLALAGTGQRGPLILFLAVVFVYFTFCGGRLLSSATVIFGAIGAALIALGTLALGRGAADVEAADSNIDRFGLLLGQFFYRLTIEGAEARVYGFRYIYEVKGVQFGNEWLETLAGLTPFSRGSTLPNEIFAYMYGSSRGNAQPSLWGSIYYNFDIIGVLLAPFLLSFIFVWLDGKIERDLRHAVPLAVIGMAGCTVVLGTWVTGTPAVSINKGLVAFLLLWWIGNRVQQSDDLLRSEKFVAVNNVKQRDSG